MLIDIYELIYLAAKIKASANNIYNKERWSYGEGFRYNGSLQL